MEIPIFIQEVSRTETITEQEASHIPFYREDDGVIIVRIGTEENPHETSEGHFIEYVGLFDADGEAVEIRTYPEENLLSFEHPELDEYEVRLSCNMHGVWRGLRITGEWPT